VTPPTTPDLTPHEAAIDFAGSTESPLDSLVASEDASLRIAYGQAAFFRRIAQALLDQLHWKLTELRRRDAQIVRLRDELRRARTHSIAADETTGRSVDPHQPAKSNLYASARGPR
jgi:hypothetical protein